MPDAFKIRFIISTKAGNGDKANLEAGIRAAYDGFEQPDIARTEYQGHAAELAREWDERYGAEGVVYVCGGDGTLNEVCQVLAGRDCAMGAIPHGTGNDFARSLYPGIPRKELLDLVLPLTRTPRRRLIDLVEVNGIPYINVMSLGLDTVVLAETYKLLKRWPKLRQNAYYLGVVLSLNKKKLYPLRYRVTLADGTEREGEVVSTIAALCNGGYYGSGFQPAPDAVLDDGIGEFILADQLKIFELIRLILLYRKGRHVGHPAITYLKCTRGVLESTDGSSYPANYDGVIFDAARFEFEVKPQALVLADLGLG